MKLLLENWRKFIKEAAPSGGFTQKPSYILFHFPSKKLHWVNTSEKSAFITPKAGELPPGKVMKTWAATSGNFSGPDGLNYSVNQVLAEVPEFVQKKIKEMHMTGPLPPGVYTTRDPQEMPEAYKKTFIDVINSAYNAIAGAVHKKLKLGSWPGGKHAWGTWRVWLTPAGADVGSRENFSIHGGEAWGSAGCIDLTTQINNLQRDYEAYTSKYNVPMLVYSEYSNLPKELFEDSYF